MKTKITLLLFAVCAVTTHTVAQTDYVIDGGMTNGVLAYASNPGAPSNMLIDYVDQTAAIGVSGSGNSWGAYFSATYHGIDLKHVTDPAGIQGTVTQISANTKTANASVIYDSRLTQRLASVPLSSTHVYRLSFKAKSISALTTPVLIVTLRTSASNVPAFIINGYTTGNATALPASASFTGISATDWTEYSVDFDLSQMVSSFTPTASPVITANAATTAIPVIGFQLSNATVATASNAIGVYIDDVKFKKK